MWYDFNGRTMDQPQGHMSDFGRCATDVCEPRQVRKEATVASLSVCRSFPKSGAQEESTVNSLQSTVFASRFPGYCRLLTVDC